MLEARPVAGLREKLSLRSQTRSEKLERAADRDVNLCEAGEVAASKKRAGRGQVTLVLFG